MQFVNAETNQNESEGSPVRSPGHKVNSSFTRSDNTTAAGTAPDGAGGDAAAACLKRLDLNGVAAEDGAEEAEALVEDGGARVNLAMRGLGRVPASLCARYGARCRELTLLENDFGACEKVRPRESPRAFSRAGALEAPAPAQLPPGRRRRP